MKSNKSILFNFYHLCFSSFTPSTLRSFCNFTGIFKKAEIWLTYDMWALIVFYFNLINVLLTVKEMIVIMTITWIHIIMFFLIYPHWSLWIFNETLIWTFSRFNIMELICFLYNNFYKCSPMFLLYLIDIPLLFRISHNRSHYIIDMKDFWNIYAIISFHC